MPKAFDTWNVLPHQPIETLASNLWSVTGKLPNMSLERVMVIARMSDGRLVIHNAIALEDELMQQIESWGTPAFILVPSGWHRLDCANFKRRYPRAQIVCPAGSRKKIEQVVLVDLTYDQFPGDDTVRLEHVEGMKQAEGVLVVKSEDGVTLVFNDLVFNVPHQPGFDGFLLRMLRSTGGPKVTGLMRLLAVKDKSAVKQQLLRLADTPGLVRLVPGHGSLISTDAPAMLRSMAGTL